MDKKQAEEELHKKAKDAQAAAGKSNGMSGRDLVSSSLPQTSRSISRYINETILLFLLLFSILFQFSYNPEWFADEEEEEDDWDLAKYRQEKEDEDLAAEERRIAELQISDGHSPGGEE